MKMINQFTGSYSFLSNFYLSPIVYENRVYKTVEHFYQASKTDDLILKTQIIDCESPADAKAMGKKVPLITEWLQKRDSVMETGLDLKFAIPDLKNQLLSTGDAELIEGNFWHDTYWGVDLRTGQGFNILGKMLMKLRYRLTMDQIQGSLI